MKAPIRNTSPFEPDENALYIDFESDDGHSRDGYSYLCLRQVRILDIGSQRERIMLIFDQGLGEIVGDNLLLLYEEIKKHQISLVRKGISDKPDHPNIKKITFKESDSEIIQKSKN